MYLKITTYAKEKSSYIELCHLLYPFVSFEGVLGGFVAKECIKPLELDGNATRCILGLQNRFRHDSLSNNIADGVMLLNYAYKHLYRLENEFIQHNQHSIVTAIEPFVIFKSFNEVETGQVPPLSKAI